MGPFWLLSIAVSAAVIFFVLYPILRMFLVAFVKDGVPDLSAVLTVLSEPWLPETLLNTVIVVASSCILSLVVGSLIAWLNERTDARLGPLGDLLPIVPLLVPSIGLAIGWVFLASPGAGFLNGALGATLGRIGIDIPLDIASWGGTVFVYTIHSVPFVYLIVGAAFRNLDPSYEEASRTSGAGSFTTFRRISVPAIKPALLAAGLLVIMISTAMYSIPTIVAERAGISVLSVRIFRMLNAEYPPNLDQAAVLSTLLVLVIMSLWVVQRRLVSRGNFAEIAGKGSQFSLVKLGPWRWLARFLMVGYFLCAAVLPLCALIIVALQPFWQSTIVLESLSLDNFWEAFVRDRTTRAAFQNSIVLGAVGGALGMLIAAVVTLYSLRSTSALGRLVDGITKLPAAFTHLAIAVGFLLAFAGPPFGLGGTSLILLLVYIVLYLPEASLSASSAATQVGQELVEASATAGGSDTRTFFRITLPLMLPGLIAGWALLFVLMAGEVTASALLSGIGQPVIGFVILSAWDSGTFGLLAALAAGVSVMNIVVVLVAMRVGRPKYRGG